MTKLGRVAHIASYAVGGLIGLCGVILLLGAGGDNGNRATYIEFGGRHVSTYLVGAVVVALAGSVVAATAAVAHRSR